MKTTTPLTRTAGMPRPASPIRSCGKPYATEADAVSAAVLLTEKSTRPGTFHSAECRQGCSGWHVTYRKPAKTAEEKRRPAPRDTGPDAKTRALVLERDGWSCVCCGRSVISQVYSLQHRQRRGQGGTNCPSNLIVVLGDGARGCHARIDSRIDPHDEAQGYTVRSGKDPAAVSVMIHSEHGSGCRKWLTPEGTYSDSAPDEEAA
jgi:hypothetical protein